MSTARKKDARQKSKPLVDLSNPSQPDEHPEENETSQPPPDAENDAKREVYSDEEEEAVMQRLRDLGYV